LYFEINVDFERKIMKVNQTITMKCIREDDHIVLDIWGQSISSVKVNKTVSKFTIGPLTEVGQSLSIPLPTPA